MKLNDWKLADGPPPTVRRTARLRRVHILSCALLGAGLGLALAVVFVPLQGLFEAGGLPSAVSEALSGASEGAAPGFDMSHILWVAGIEALAGLVLGTVLGLCFNLLAPLLGGLAFEVELEREGSGEHALEPYEEQPVFEGR